MATGYKTFIEAKSAAQEYADKHGVNVPVYQCGTAKVYKFAIQHGRYGTRKLLDIKPNASIERE